MDEGGHRVPCGDGLIVGTPAEEIDQRSACVHERRHRLLVRVRRRGGNA